MYKFILINYERMQFNIRGSGRSEMILLLSLAIAIDARVSLFIFLLLILLCCINRLSLLSAESTHGISMRDLIIESGSQIGTGGTNKAAAQYITTKAPSQSVIV